MVKGVNDITINDFDRVETSGRIGHLRTFPLPLFLIRKRINAVLNELLEKLGSENNDDRDYALESRLKIEQLRLLYYGMMNLVENQARVNTLKRLFAPHTRRRFKIKHSDRFTFYANAIEEKIGIKVDSTESLEALRKDIIFRLDKWNENYNRPKGEAVRIITLAYRIFDYLKMPFDGNMTIIRMVELQEEKQKHEAWLKSQK